MITADPHRIMRPFLRHVDDTITNPSLAGIFSAPTTEIPHQISVPIHITFITRATRPLSPPHGQSIGTNKTCLMSLIPPSPSI
jgi:hypothetical protein